MSPRSKSTPRPARSSPRVVDWRRIFIGTPNSPIAKYARPPRSAEHLRALGLEVKRHGSPGVVAVIEGGRPGPTILLRADMGALPVTEKTDVHSDQQPRANSEAAKSA